MSNFLRRRSIISPESHLLSSLFLSAGLITCILFCFVFFVHFWVAVVLCGCGVAAGHSGRLCGIVGTSAALAQLPAPRQRVGLGWWVELACPPIGPRLPKVGHGRANCLRGFARPCLCRCARPCAPALASIGLCCLGPERDPRVGPHFACALVGLVAV